MAKRRVTESLTGPASDEDLSPFAIPYGSTAQRATGRKTMAVRKGDKPRQLAPKPTARDYAATIGSMAANAMRPGQTGFEVGARLRPAIPAIATAAKDYLTQTPLAQMGSDVLGGLRSAGEYAFGDPANAIADLSVVGAGRDFLKDVERAASLRARGGEGGAYGIEQLAPLMLAAGIVPGGGAAMREGERAALRAAEEGASDLAVAAQRRALTEAPPVTNRLYTDEIIARDYRPGETLPKYGYRNVSKADELNDIISSGYMLPPEGRTSKFFTMSDREVPSAGNRGAKPVLRVRSENIPEGRAVSARDVELWDEASESWVPILRQPQMRSAGVPARAAEEGASGLAARAVPVFRDIRAPKENIHEVMQANTTAGRVLGERTRPISELTGGVSNAADDQRRVASLVKAMSSPEGYLERLIVDDAGNVIEGQHRLEALRKLGATEVPVVEYRDFERDLPLPGMREAAQAQGIHPDQANQIASNLAEIFADEGGDLNEVRQYVPPAGFEKPWAAALEVMAREPAKTLSVPARAAEEGASGLAARAVPITTRELPLGQRMYATPEGAQLTVMENAKFAPRQHSVTDFVVPEELRGQGRGAALLDEVLGRYDPMQISAAASSPASAALFHKRGFRPVGEPEADLERALQIMRDDSSVTMAVPPSGLVAYHGSPHTFDRFDISKIGTGEGAQAYGHGLYFAEAEPVAAEYRQRLAEVSAEPFDTIGIPPREWNAALMFARQMDPTQPHAAARDFAQWVGREVTPELVDAFKVARKPGSMYRVNLAVRPEDMLNWDRPLAEQSDAVQRASLAAAQSADLSHLKPGSRPRVRLDRFIEGNEQFHDRLRGLDLLMALDQTPGNNFSPQTSEILSEAGIPGISYLDRASRDVGEGTRNYVMFSDKPVSILKRYKKGGLSVKRKKAA